MLTPLSAGKYQRALIDFAKCEGYIGFHQDQALHVGLKAGYVFAL